jgi:hypothetical protein
LSGTTLGAEGYAADQGWPGAVAGSSPAAASSSAVTTSGGRTVEREATSGQTAGDDGEAFIAIRVSRTRSHQVLGSLPGHVICRNGYPGRDNAHYPQTKISGGLGGATCGGADGCLKPKTSHQGTNLLILIRGMKRQFLINGADNGESSLVFGTGFRRRQAQKRGG